MSALRVALLQSSGHPADVDRNLAALDEAAHRAARDGAGLLVCPELFLSGYAIGADLHRLAEPADGPAAGAVARTAAARGLAIAYGYPERGPRGELFNAVRLVGPDGDALADYRKTHLFGDYEQQWFTPGRAPVVQARLGALTVGLLVCYDVEFPENVRAHALAGTDLLLVPTALAHPYSFVAESLVPVRAFENQLYLAYANRTGPEGEWDFTGLSCLAAPDGTTGVRAGHDPGLLVGDVDPQALRASRAANPYLHDRRPALYSALASPARPA